MWASGGFDCSFPPEQSGRLAEALRNAEIDHVIENYIGMSHGWAVPDHGVYDERGAERHWKRLIDVLRGDAEVAGRFIGVSAPISKHAG